jgi:anti-anti-sigma regulatory factor
MAQLAPSWVADVERGPAWLFVRLNSPEGCGDGAELSDTIWSLVERHFTYRLVLECDELVRLDSTLVAQLLVLDRRLHARGGMLRLCGLSELNQQVLERCRLNGRFPCFRNRSHAVLGDHGSLVNHGSPGDQGSLENNRPQQPR